jgi:ATP-dependent RNA helicase DeaD
MDSFEELDLAPEIVEALAAEGIEVPTALQSGAIPVLRRGNNLVARAGPGSGSLAAYGCSLLDRLEAGNGSPSAIVLVPTMGAASRLAESLGRLAVHTGHTVAALGPGWALPERADILFATTDNLLAAVRTSAVKLDGLRSLVVDSAASVLATSDPEALQTLLESLPRGAQRALFSLPWTPAVDAFAGTHLRKAVHVPPRAAVDEGITHPPERGELRYVVGGEPREEVALDIVGDLLADTANHVLVFVRSEDRAADVGDYFTLHGFPAGAPGDPDIPVWLGVHELESRSAVEEAGGGAVPRVSVDVPGDADSLDRRHGGADGTVLVLPRELPHLQQIAAEAGYTLKPAPHRAPSKLQGVVDRLRCRIATAAEREDLGPYLLVLEPLFARFAPAELAAAAVALLRERPTPSEAPPAPTPDGRQPPAWIRLFISLGSRDGVGPGDLVGAITGEAGVEGSRIGKIEIRDTLSLVEVERGVAESVIKALNGTTVRGRSVRVDYDRPRTREYPPRRRKGGDRKSRRDG